MDSTKTDAQSLALNDDDLATVEKGASGFGLAGVGDNQRAALRVLARVWGLQIGRDLTFMFGQPYVTFPGRLKIARRHPQFAGWSARAIFDEREKAAWGCAPDDILIEGTMRTRTWGEITARGKVTAAERAVAKDKEATLPVQKDPGQQGEKRALMRASRLAFGEDQPTDEEFERAYQRQLVEQADEVVNRSRVEVRERPAVTASDYDRVIGRWYDDEPGQLPPPAAINDPEAPSFRVDTQTGEVIDVPGEVAPETIAMHQSEPDEQLPDLGEPVEPPMPKPPVGGTQDDDSLGAFLTRLRRRIDAHPDRKVVANKALQMAAGTAVLRGCDNERAAAKQVLKVLTARTDNLTQLTMAEAEEILALSGADPGQNEEWQTWCGLMFDRATQLAAAR